MRDTQYTTAYRPLHIVLFRSPIVGTDVRGPSLGSAIRTSASIIVARVKLMRAFTHVGDMHTKRILRRVGIVAGNSTDLLGRRPSPRQILGQKRLCVFGNFCPPSPFPLSLFLSASRWTSMPSSLTSRWWVSLVVERKWKCIRMNARVSLMRAVNNNSSLAN